MGGNMQNRARGADPTLPRLLGERLCLDFVNTVESPRGAHPEEFLHQYADLARWARHVGIVDEGSVAALLRAAAADPDGAAATFARARDLRAALTDLFRALARGDSPPADALATTRAAYLDALAHADLTPGAGGYRWTWPDDAALDRPLWPVAASAIALLTEGDPARLKECPGAGDCGWLFYDTSKNGSRRWCSMEGCGSRVKMRHQYARKRASGG